YEDVKIATLNPLEFNGRVNKEAMDFIDQSAFDIINSNKFLISLGAEHSISYPLFLAHQKKFTDIGLLQFDAHSDLRDAYQNNKYSHASVAARINEHNVSITQVGIRALCKEEADLIKNSSLINTFFAHDIHNDKNWVDKVIESLPDNIYVTIDADGFDPSIMPAVGTPEPNGLSWQQAMQLFEQVFKKKNVVGFDVLEMAPRENEMLSQYNLAKLVYRLIGFKSLKN
ncbi:MAG: agmatinase, partial [Bacteroidia bacterium]|nr:agmatinase [Bacteroidia bacterium]